VVQRLTGWLRGSKAAVAFVLGLLLLTAVFWLSFRNTERLVVDAGWRQHTYLVIAEIRGLLNALIDAQTGERGYLLSGDEGILGPYDQGSAEVPRRIARLRTLTADNPRQQRRLAALAPAAAAMLDTLDRGIARRRAAGPAGPGLALQPEDRRLMAGLRARVSELEGEETHLLAVRDQAMVTAIRRTDLSLLAGLAASAALSAAAFLALRREIGQRRQAEQATRALNTRLAIANRELEAFCYSVSHDLRAPLRAIDGFSLALLEDAAPRLEESARQHLGRVRAAAQRMAGLIDDLLRLSRISQTPIEPRDVDLSELTRSIVAELRDRDPARGVAVEIESGVRAAGDERLLRIALENLLGNAWKFTRNREPAHIAFGVEHDADGPVYCVWDDGAGFDMAYTDKLFGAFQRLHSDREFEGSGIGLATVARVVHLHGGRVWAEAEVGKGATLRFTLAAGAAAPATKKEVAAA
jgi:signal transduction histidine kinase